MIRAGRHDEVAESMGSNTAPRLRVLVADGRRERFQQVTDTVTSLGHEVAGAGDLASVSSLTASVAPDVAIVVVSEGSARALTLIRRIVTEAACPVIAILDVQDPAFVKEAAKIGIFAYIVGGEDPDEFQSSIDISLRRFAEYHDLEGAFGRRAVTERAKGILMERHSVGEEEAFNILREEARRTNRKIVDVADAVIRSHRLLPDTAGRPVGDQEDSGPGRESRL
jgi:AmiR/NasT family two-component response regulator